MRIQVGGAMGAMGGTPRRISSVLFDLGGTLTDGRDFEGWSADAVRLGVPASPEGIASAWDEVKPWLGHREDSPHELWNDLLSRAANGPVSSDRIRRFLALQQEKPIFGVLFSDVRRCLERLGQAGKRLGIVSNSRSESAVRGLLRTLDLEATFEIVVSSGTEGVRKPNPEIFGRALARLKVAPLNVLFVGDDIENDYDGATAAGLSAVWLNRFGTGEVSPCPEILSLSEVPRVVRLLEAGAPVI